MADILLMSGAGDSGCTEDTPEQDGGGGGVAPQQCPPNDHDEQVLSPSANLERYANADAFNRQMVPSILLEVLRDRPHVVDANGELPKMMEVLQRLAEDTEMNVRAELVQKMPHIAAACDQNTVLLPALSHVFEDHLLPLLAKYLRDSTTYVRKLTHVTILSLLENDYIPKAKIEDMVCREVLCLVHPANLTDCWTEPITLISKMVPFLGRELTEQLFLPRLMSLCKEPKFWIRSTCASSLGEFCATVSSEKYHSVLLPCYMELCEDDNWQVRKACAEVIMAVSCACEHEPRKRLLAPAYCLLLRDQSRWVRLAALLNLGPFISTFALHNPVELTYTYSGELVLITTYGDEFSINGISPADASSKTAFNFKGMREEITDEDIQLYNDLFGCPTPDVREVRKVLDDDDPEKYNLYQYWYISPELPLDPAIVDGVAAPVLATKAAAVRKRNTKSDEDDIVPSYLVEHYVQMAHARAEDEAECDIAYHCAFSLPAVARTLQRSNWHLLQGLCDTLASNLQYKVRKTIASCLHELAGTLGPELTVRYLLTILDDVMKDLDEVRMGFVPHLAEFFKVLDPKTRHVYLPKLARLCKMDSPWKWRYRKQLARQLQCALHLFEPAEIVKHLTSLALQLLCDKVAAVRRAALTLNANLVKHVSSHRHLTAHLLSQLTDKLATSHYWVWRQTFVLLVSRMVTSQMVIPTGDLLQAITTHLVQLSRDPIPNVRLAMSRLLARDLQKVLDTEGDCGDGLKDHRHELSEALRSLQNDEDRDVRQFAEVEQYIVTAKAPSHFS